MNYDDLGFSDDDNDVFKLPNSQKKPEINNSSSNSAVVPRVRG
jgi:hypothetical protein